MLAALSLSDTQGAVVFAGSSAGVIVGSFLLRPVARRSAVRCMQLSMVGLALGIALTGAAAEIATLSLASFLFGVALGGLALSQNLMVERSVPEHLRRRALTGLHSIYGLASLLAPAAVSGLVVVGADWRTILYALAGPPLLVALALFSLRSGAKGPDAPHRPGGRLGRRTLIAAMAGCCVLAELLLSTRLPLLMERLGYAKETAALSLSLFFLCLLASRLAFSVIPLRLSNRRLLGLSAGGGLVVCVVGLTIQPWALPLAALALGPFFPTVVALLAEEFPGELDSALAVLFAVASLMVMTAHGAVGVLSDLVTLQKALWLTPAALLAALVLLGVVSRGSPAAREAAA